MGFFKSVSKAFKSVTKAVVKVTVGIVSGSYLFKAVGTVVKFIGSTVLDDALGLDKIGNEVANIGSDIVQVSNVLNGDYHKEAKRIADMQDNITNQQDTYNSQMDELIDRANQLMAFHEIFKIALGNDMDSLEAGLGAEITKLIAEYELVLKRFKSDYEFIIGLTEGNFLGKLVASVILIVGGLMNDLSDILTGNADSTTFKNIGMTIIGVIVLIIAILASPFTAGGSMYIAFVVLSSIMLYLSLDSMYAGGVGMAAVMSCLDILFNDVLQLDSLIGKDFQKFDPDNEDYADMVMYVKIGLTLATIATGGLSNAGTAIKQSATNIMGAAAANISMTFSQIYGIYSTAMSVKNVIDANDANNVLKEKLEAERVKVETLIFQSQSRKFMKSYRDVDYIQSDQESVINSYTNSFTGIFIDPEIYVPMNSRFTPDEEASKLISFGFEDIFNPVLSN